ncbi:unnamed protein product [Paramecium octaurelia]|uniref:Uncharacterized protein n=1 Tax=Paramecium octaurelia TaxID=43137 RepID=A0A8S1Y3A0_PAROT|nr:unnamed protein product [Paramecium octaurelia]
MKMTTSARKHYHNWNQSNRSFNQQKYDDFETKPFFDYQLNKQNAEDVMVNVKQMFLDGKLIYFLEECGNLCSIPFCMFKTL